MHTTITIPRLTSNTLQACIKKKQDVVHGFSFSVEADELGHVQMTVAVFVETLKQHLHLRQNSL